MNNLKLAHLKTFTLALMAIGTCSLQNLHAQIFVASQSGTIGEYNTNGTVINADLITGLSTSSNAGPSGLAVMATSNGINLFTSDTANGAIYEYTINGGTVSSQTTFATLASGNPTSLAVSGSNLYVADDDTGNVLAYNLSGATHNSTTIVSGLGDFSPRSLAISGSNLYISNTNNIGTVGEYVPGTGYSTILSSTNDSHIAYPIGLAVSSNNLFVTNNNNNTVSEYSLSGTNDSTATINNSFSIATPLKDPIGLAVSGNDLLVGNFNTGNVQAFSIPGGGSADNSFTTISGLSNPEQIAVLAPVPEPSSLGLLSLGLCGLLILHRNQRRRVNA